MTKAQLRIAGLAILDNHKVAKGLKDELISLLDEYVNAGKAPKREKNITVKEKDYRWCNRHELYEPVDNFNQKDSCKLAVKVWSELGKDIKKLEDNLNQLIEDEKYDLLKDAKKSIDELKKIRGGKYNWVDDSTKYPDIEDYDYKSDDFIRD